MKRTRSSLLLGFALVATLATLPSHAQSSAQAPAAASIAAATSAADDLKESAANARKEKHALVMKLLDVMDARQLTRAMLDVVFSRMTGKGDDAFTRTLTPEERQTYEAQIRKQQEELQTFRARFYARADFQKFAEQNYAPIIDKTFTADELRELIAFYKTKAGQKSVQILPELTIGAMVEGNELLRASADAVAKEMRDEDDAKRPWRKAMSDIRSLATALEARATDENDYPAVTTLDDLRGKLEPIYIKTMPVSDPWGGTYVYVVSADKKHYRIVSGGADKRLDWDSSTITTLVPDAQAKKMPSLDDDIIYQDGQFVQVPAASDDK